VYLAVTAAAGMDLSEIIREINALPEAETMSVVTGSLDLLVRLRLRDHTHLRQLLLEKIFQITGVQRTETFLSIADIDPENFTATLLEDMIQQRGASSRP
jgi:Lrp/AsnC family leucine-responsive transcriptional regulator